ncbi:hypothetical protein ES703_54609 [subsurface metagenome]
MPKEDTAVSRNNKTVMIEAVNKLQIDRPGQTIELSFKDLAALGEKDLTKIHIRDTNGRELLSQAVDTDGDYTPDQLIFQADFTAGQTRTFKATVGDKWVYKKNQFRAYGPFRRVLPDL